MARLSAFTEQVRIFNSNFTGAARAEALATAAIAARDEALAKNTAALGRPPSFVTIVDGKQGASEMQVRVGGTIVYLFAVGSASLEEAVDAAAQLYHQIAPRGPTGRYAEGLRLLVNGTERSYSRAGTAVRLLETDEVQLTNLLPYARKIERGWSAQAPNGVFEVVATALRQRYGNLLKIGFSYDRFPGAAAGPVALGPNRRPRASALSRAERFPTINLAVK